MIKAGLVEGDLKGLDPVIARVKKALAEPGLFRRQIKYVPGIRCSIAMSERVLLLLDSVAKSARRFEIYLQDELRGSPGYSPLDCYFTNGVDRLYFSIQEPARMATKEELAELESRRSKYSSPIDRVPSGLLEWKFHQLNYHYKARIAWKDAKTFKLEDCVPEILAEARRVLLFLADFRRTMESVERWHEKWRDVDRSLTKQRDIEAAAMNELITDADRHKEAEALRAYIEAVKDKLSLTGPDEKEARKFAMWVEWAEIKASQIDPVSRVANSWNSTSFKEFYDGIEAIVTTASQHGSSHS